MTNFKTPASELMSSPIRTVRASASGLEADRLLDEHGITALGVIDDEGALVGVVSLTDLLSSSDAESGATFRVSEEPVRRLMTPDPVTVDADSPLDEIAKLMLKRRIHRVFVSREGAPVGVVSTRDMMRAVYQKRVKLPAIEVATKSIIRVAPDDSVSLAVDRLERSNKQGLIVVEDGWPVGTFSQRDAMLARAHDPRTPVEEVMNPQILVVPPSLALHRVAQQALAMGVRRILLVEDDIAGVVSTFDFARVVK